MTTQFKSYHIVISIDLIFDTLKRQQLMGNVQAIVMRNNNPITYEQAFKELKAMKRKGLEYFPQCEHCDSLGKCLGHIKDVKA